MLLILCLRLPLSPRGQRKPRHIVCRVLLHQKLRDIPSKNLQNYHLSFHSEASPGPQRYGVLHSRVHRRGQPARDLQSRLPFPPKLVLIARRPRPLLRFLPHGKTSPQLLPRLRLLWMLHSSLVLYKTRIDLSRPPSRLYSEPSIHNRREAQQKLPSMALPIPRINSRPQLLVLVLIFLHHLQNPGVLDQKDLHISLRMHHLCF